MIYHHSVTHLLIMLCIVQPVVSKWACTYIFTVSFQTVLCYDLCIIEWSLRIHSTFSDCAWVYLWAFSITKILLSPACTETDKRLKWKRGLRFCQNEQWIQIIRHNLLCITPVVQWLLLSCDRFQQNAGNSAKDEIWEMCLSHILWYWTKTPGMWNTLSSLSGKPVLNPSSFKEREAFTVGDTMERLPLYKSCSPQMNSQ